MYVIYIYTVGKWLIGGSHHLPLCPLLELFHLAHSSRAHLLLRINNPFTSMSSLFCEPIEGLSVEVNRGHSTYVDVMVYRQGLSSAGQAAACRSELYTGMTSYECALKGG